MYAQSVSKEDMNKQSGKVEYIEVDLDELIFIQEELSRMKNNGLLGNSSNSKKKILN